MTPDICDHVGGVCYEAISEGQLIAILGAVSVFFHAALIGIPIWWQHRRESRTT